MGADAWEGDIDVNLNHPFYLARAAMRRMREQGAGGRILLTGTESGVARRQRGSRCPTPSPSAARNAWSRASPARGRRNRILVNGVRFGFIESGFHERWHGRTEDDLARRADMVPLKRGGRPEEAAALMIFLLSGWAQFITGQMIPLTGGDWL